MSRIIVKNLPSNATEKDIRNKFKEQGNITDIKLATRDGKFRGFAFIGFESPQQAEKAVKFFNNTFYNSIKITVEIAKDLSDKTRPKACRQLREEQKLVEKKRQEEKTLRIQLSHLRQAGSDQDKKNKLLAKYKDDPKFQQYLELTAGHTNSLGYSAPSQPSLEDDKAKEGGAGSGDEDEDEGIEEDEDKIAKREEVSDSAYWDMLSGNTCTAAATAPAEEKKEEDTKQSYQDSPSKQDSHAEQSSQDSPTKKKKKKKEFVQFFTARLRIDKFPKRRNNTVSTDKKKKKNAKYLTKEDIKEFFKPLKCESVRMNNKNKFEYFIGFATEKILNQALRKDNSFILGVRVSLHVLPSPSSSSSEATLQHGKGAAPWSEAEQRLERSEPVAESGRLYVRNLCYLITEEQLRQAFAKYGEICELDLPVCKQTRKLKGFATVTYLLPQCAVAAMNALDGTELMGRLIHVLPALSEEQVNQQKAWTSIFKKEKEEKLKATAASWHNWNTLFLSSTAVVDIMAKKYGKTKEEILSSEGGQSAAVTLALGETQIVDETRRFLEEQGVSVEAFTDPSVSRSDTVLLVKNLPAGTKATVIAELFGKWGELGRVVMPPSGTTCIVEFLTASEARKALRNMHYSRFGHVPLYLEMAPVKTFTTEYTKPQHDEREEEKEGEEGTEGEKRKRTDEDEGEGAPSSEEAPPKKVKREPELHTTIYVQNLPKESSEEDIMKHFSSVGEVHTVILARKGDQSRGYGFVQFVRQKDAREALIKLDNSTLGGRNLALRLSEKKLAPTVKTSRQMHEFGEQTSAKISVKNIPFQATRKEVDQLFRPFGTLKRVFLQKHHTGEYNNGGYGFVEFITVEDAKRALDALGLSTHFLGRRLVLQWAKEDETVDELRAKTATKRDIVQAMGAGQKKMRHALRDTEAAGGDGDD